jgi:hypothetical protein
MQTTAEAREELLDRLGRAIEAIEFALTSLGAAYEQLDQFKADELEEKLFQPAQRAFGRAKRTHTEFATRHGITGRKFESSSAGLPSIGAKAFIENAVTAVGRADVALSELQDSLLPVDVGDPELRAGLAELRELLAGFDERARELVRTLGR